MPQIVLALLQGLFLLLFYLFVARAVRAILRDVTISSQQRRKPATAGSAKAQRTEPPPSTAPATGSAAQQEPRTAPSEVVVHSQDGKPRVLQLDGREISFGRNEHASVRITDPYTSDQHARIYHDGRTWLIHDLGSTNGTYLNKERLTEPTPIAAGDQLGIGRTVVEVRK